MTTPWNVWASDALRAKAEAEGWCLIESDNRGVEIERDDEGEVFTGPYGDDDARRWLRAFARAGDRLAVVALALHQHCKRRRLGWEDSL